MASTTTAYGPYDGYNYENSAAVALTNGSFAPWTYVKTQNGASVPAGYMGANARLYNANTNALVYKTGMDYLDSSSNNFSTVYFGGQLSGSYYSYGVTAAYNGNGYTDYYTFKSPSLTN